MPGRVDRDRVLVQAGQGARADREAQRGRGMVDSDGGERDRHRRLEVEPGDGRLVGEQAGLGHGGRVEAADGVDPVDQRGGQARRPGAGSTT